MRLWTLLYAQALLRGSIGGASGALNAEDDRWRLAHRGLLPSVTGPLPDPAFSDNAVPES
jgi:hypothetical protein